ncbi:MAG: chorismate-binding protein, partial [Candidatus Rokubacteria bacterium]|nr:chorismate-binding protein [Candidatus Rokubacteria bacterium]
RIGMTLAKLSRPARAPTPLVLSAPGPLVALGEEGFASTMSEREFTDAVKRAKEFIASGDAYQIVLSRRLDCRLTGDPFTLYRALRTINPSPYLFFLRLGKTTIVGSSPEVLVRVEGDRVDLRPIAGTHPRGAGSGKVRGAGGRAGRPSLAKSIPIFTAAWSYARSREAGSVLPT